MSEAKHHVVPVSTYLIVFGVLLVLTALTVWAAGQDFGIHRLLGLSFNMNTITAVSIAAIKATLVLLFFMHVKYGTKLVKLFVAAGFIWLFIMIAITLADYVSRGWSIMSV